MRAEILRAVETLSEPGGVVELRALKNGTTAAGYFDDFEALSAEASKLTEQGFAVYVTANPIKPALLSRAANRIRRSPKETTSDRDVLRRRWLLVDFDPVRPAGVSATDDEKSAALWRAKEVRDHLQEAGWPEPVAGDSGNGTHLLYPVDLPNDRESLDLVRGVLEALSFRYSDGRVCVDTKTANAARIWKLYGTTARKGDSTEDRPHRVSKLLKIPDERVEVGREQLEAAAAMKPEQPNRGPRMAAKGYPEFELASWIEEHGVTVRREGPWQQGYRYILEECPWQGHTDNACYIVQGAGGWIAAGCQHDSCQGRGWRELRKHYEPEAYEHGRYKRNGRAGGPENAGEASEGGWGILLSEVKPERVEWLWEGRIPRGKITLIDGDPGTGKSAATTDLAARVSVGKPWPDGSECRAGGVMILSAEDGLADTIRPRFDAAGGDPARAVALSTVPDAEGNERQLSIPDDLAVVEAEIERVGAVLVVVDPLMAFLPGDVNSHRDQDVRRALAPASRLAERTGAAVVVVRHLNKATGGNALYRGGGSIGIVGAARSGLLVAKHPEDGGRRVLASVKSNLAAPAPSLVFGLGPAENGAVRVDWKGESTLDASALLSVPTDHEERSVLQEARDLLREVLSEGPVPAAEVKDEARSADISERTLKTAKRELGVIASREGEAGKRGGGRWIWALPAAPRNVKGAKPEGLHPKSGTDRTDAENSACASQERGVGLRVQSTEVVKGTDGSCTLKRPLSADLLPGQTGTLVELRARRDDLSSEQEETSAENLEGLKELLAAPPEWLRRQIRKHLEAPREGTLEALCAAVAYEILSDPRRGQEVRPDLEEALEKWELP